MIKNNNEKENRELYRQTFDEIHASEELLERIKAMEKDETMEKDEAMENDEAMGKGRKRIPKLLRFGFAAAAAAAIFVVANGFTGTRLTAGESWTDTVTIYINGVACETTAESAVNIDGTPYVRIDLGEYGSFGLNEDNYKVVEIHVDGDPDSYTIYATSDDTEVEYPPEVEVLTVETYDDTEIE